MIKRHSVPRYISFYRAKFELAMPVRSVLDGALRVADTYSLSHWDSILIAACIEAGVDTLYTEDMDAPRQIESVRLVNPFAP